MSATNRSEAAGTGHVRHPDDFYRTPAWCTRAILPYVCRFGLCWPTGGEGDVIVDPCCGDGAILDVIADTWPKATRLGVEIDGDRCIASHDRGHRVSKRDALSVGPWHHTKPRLVITNPPYSLAEDFVRRALDEVAEGGVVAMLLRLPFLASMKRAAWLRSATPSVHVLPKRPSFTGKGTDSTDYGWFVWDGRPPRVVILEVDPKGGAS